MSLFKDTARTRALREYASRNGLRFEVSDAYGLTAYFGDMKLFRQGFRRHARHILERKAKMFEHHGVMDYAYTVRAGNTNRTHRQTVYFRVCQTLMLPAFHIFPEKWYHKIGKWFGMQDIHFLTYPEFSEYYLLQGAQPDFIQKFFSEEQLISHFTRHRQWTVEAVGKFLVMYKPDTLIPANQIGKFLETGDKLFTLIEQRNAVMEQIFLPSSDAEEK